MNYGYIFIVKILNYILLYLNSLFLWLSYLYKSNNSIRNINSIGISEAEDMKIWSKLKFSCPRCHEWLYSSNLFFWLPTPHLNFLPANHETQICLGGTLTLISAFQRNFSTPVSLSYGVGNMKKKIFAPPKNCGGASKLRYSDELHHYEFIYARILLNLPSTFFLSQHLFPKFSINFFFKLDIDPIISGG